MQKRKSKTIQCWALFFTAMCGTDCSVDIRDDLGAGGKNQFTGEDSQGYVVLPANATPCVNPSDCPSGFCVDGVCCNAACTGFCRACTAAKKGSGVDGTCGTIGVGLDPDNECPNTCNGLGGCSKVAIYLGLGADCSQGSQCASGYCVEGVCCDSSCTGTCQACTVAFKGSGTNGTCGNIAPNTDPQNECAAGDCNGLGACGAPPGASPDGSACASGNTCSSGYCVDGVCCGSACTGLCQACTASKKGSGTNGTCGPIDAGIDPDNECSAGHCNGAGTCATVIVLGNGSGCSNNAQCSSGACVDGYCCDSLCTEACKSCNVPGSIGICNETTPGSCSLSTCTGTVGLPGEPVIPTGAYPKAMVLGDFDGNGLDDMAIALGGGSASVMLAQGNGVFATSNYPVTAAPTCIVTGDFNGDMLPDLALGNCPGKTGNAAAFVSVLLNNGNGTFAAAVTSSLVLWTMDMVAGDLNGDNKADLVVAHNSGISVYLGNGNGSFGAPVNYGVGSGTRKMVAMADMDANGSNDLVITSHNVNEVSVLLNQGAGTFGPAVDYVTGVGPRRMAMADWNGDGTRDLAVVNDTSPTLSLFFNTGNGILAPKVDLNASTTGIDILASDINGDNQSDLIVFSYPVGVNILLNQGGGTFAPSVGYQSTETIAMGAADFNGDNQRDLVLLHSSWDDISMMCNQGNGTFPVRNTLNVEYNADSAVTADFDNNGMPDILVRNRVPDVSMNNPPPDSMSVFLNQGNATFAPRVDYLYTGFIAVVAGDLDGDTFHDIVAIRDGNLSVRMNQGNGTFAAPIDYPQSPASLYQLAAADVNGDGKIDVVTGVGSTNVGVFLNTGNGTLAPRVDYVVATSGTSLHNLATGDLNGDGQSDILAGVSFGNLRVLLSQGNGSFGAPMTYPVGSSFLQQLVVEDLDGDGLLDVVAADLYDSTFAVFRNLGNGTLTKVSTYSLKQRPRGLAVADVDRDGIKDLLFASGTIEMSRVLLYRGLGNNLFTYVARYETMPSIGRGIITADFDGDNAPDFAAIASGGPGVNLAIMLNRCLP